jgi:RNA-directed DNA polymerase
MANLYLHYVLDLWAHQWRRRHARGDLVIVRYADDLAVGFEHEEDGRRFLDDLRRRLREFKLELHEAKTRLIEFSRCANATRRRRGEYGATATFCFLGFVHICGRSRRGQFLLTRHTDPKRMRATLKAINLALKRRQHDPVPEQGRWLIASSADTSRTTRCRPTAWSSLGSARRSPASGAGSCVGAVSGIA